MHSSGSSPEASAGALSARHIERVRELAELDHQPMFATSRRDGSVQATLVRAGVFDNPLTGRPAVASLLMRNTLKTRNLRRFPRATIMFRSTHHWVTVEGHATLIGPDDPVEGFEGERFRQLRREVYKACAGNPADWDGWDRKMDKEGRAVVFVEIERVYSNISWTEDQPPIPSDKLPEEP
jgi:PPOX class probable F420-dependent enzyme